MKIFKSILFLLLVVTFYVTNQTVAFSNSPAPQKFYTIRDCLDSIMGLVDSSGSIVARYDYDAWGNPITVVVSSAYMYTLTNFCYRWQCCEYVPLISDNTIRTGLYYFRNRWYDPVAGRFLSKGPIGFDGGDLNLYVFCNNDLVNNRDPYGLTEVDWASGMPAPPGRLRAGGERADGPLAAEPRDGAKSSRNPHFPFCL